MRYLLFIWCSVSLLAQPEIIQLRYGPPLPQLTNLEYSATNATPIFVEFPNDSTPDGLISETVSMGVSATLSLTWTNVNLSNSYAVYSCTEFVLPRGDFIGWPPASCTNCFTPPPQAPDLWVRSSLWLTPTGTSISWTQSFGDGQRFFKIIER